MGQLIATSLDTCNHCQLLAFFRSIPKLENYFPLKCSYPSAVESWQEQMNCFQVGSGGSCSPFSPTCGGEKRIGHTYGTDATHSTGSLTAHEPTQEEWLLSPFS